MTLEQRLETLARVYLKDNDPYRNAFKQAIIAAVLECLPEKPKEPASMNPLTATPDQIFTAAYDRGYIAAIDQTRARIGAKDE